MNPEDPNYDWTDDPNLSFDETAAIVQSLEPAKPLGHPQKGPHSAPGGLRTVPLGEYLTQIPTPFYRAPKEPQ